MFSFTFNGIELNRGDFDESLRDYIAYSIAFCCAADCRDKEAALELLRHEADNIIEVCADPEKALGVE